MGGDADGLKSLFLGEDRRLTRTAVVAAVVLFLTAMLVDYITLSSFVAGRDPGSFLYIQATFRLDDLIEGPISPTWAYGYLLVTGLAAIHAYFNSGYLPSLFLALSPNIGTALWSIHGFDEYLVLTPLLVPGRVLPEGPIVATLGFVIGIALRSVVYRSAAADSPPPSIPDR